MKNELDVEPQLCDLRQLVSYGVPLSESVFGTSLQRLASGPIDLLTHFDNFELRR